jgi:hypothetical protein
MSHRDKLKNRKGPEQFIYYMSVLEGSPCNICLVQPLCRKSFLDNSACDIFAEFIENYVMEKENESENRFRD